MTVRFPRRFRFGRLLGLWFLFHHPIFVVLIGVAVFAVYLARRRR